MMVDHLATHAESDGEVHICPVEGCSQTLKIAHSRLFRIRRHLHRHYDITTVSCDLCEWTGYNNTDLQYHIEGGHEQGEYQCELCDRKLHTIGGLRDHRHSHQQVTETGEFGESLLDIEKATDAIT